MPVDTLLWEYGRYFMLNGLTSHLCACLLTQVTNGRDLLLMMHTAHVQMRRCLMDEHHLCLSIRHSRPRRMNSHCSMRVLANSVLCYGDQWRERRSGMDNTSRSLKCPV